ncbi:hypothetical protein BBP40_005460 [Aspergillus hancockii]|nr:hypothetical protein BBP40_005460 [Aspergillus hancockii]
MRQEKYLRQYIGMFITHLHQQTDQALGGHGAGVVNFTRWLNFLTTDIICELTFGESFGGLENGELHPSLSSVFWTLKASTFIREMNRWSVFITSALSSCVPRKIIEHQEAVISFGENAATRRVQLGTTRPDFLSDILKQTGDMRMTQAEVELAAVTFIIAGSETVATMLAGTVYLLCTNPLVLRKLTERIRADFIQESDLSLVKLQQHQYLNAVLLESLRLYPPAPDNLFRRTMGSGAIIMGEIVPPRTCVTMNLWAANRSTLNFHRPNDMVPERWIKPCPPEFQGDDRDTVKPFSVGPRDCLGKK